MMKTSFYCFARQFYVLRGNQLQKRRNELKKATRNDYDDLG